MEVGTNCNSVLVAKGIQLLLDDGNPFQSYCHFSSAIESTKSEEEKCKMIQFRDAAAAALVRMELESGDNYAKLGRFGSALEAYSSIRDKSTVPLMIHFQMLNNAGVCLARLGRKEESLAMQLKAFALNPHSSKTLKNIAILLADLGKFEEAISAFDAYLNKHPESYSALCGKAGCLKDLLMYAESITVAEQAQHIDPKLLRGRCAYDLKEHCRLELSRLRNIKNDSITISAPTVALASYFPNVSVNADNPDFNFDIWFNSVSSNISNKNLYDDFNIPNNRCCEASQALLREEELTASSPVIRYTERTLADFSRVPGNDMILSSTPIKQDACMTSNRVCYESTPLPDGVDESKVVYSKVFINEAKHVDSQGLVTREQRITANILNCPMQQMAATSSESRALGVIPYSRNNSTLVNNRNLRIKSVSSLENQKDQDHSILPSNNQPSPPGGWLKSPVAASAMSHEAGYENSQGKLITSLKSLLS